MKKVTRTQKCETLEDLRRGLYQCGFCLLKYRENLKIRKYIYGIRDYLVKNKGHPLLI